MLIFCSKTMKKYHFLGTSYGRFLTKGFGGLAFRSPKELFYLSKCLQGAVFGEIRWFQGGIHLSKASRTYYLEVALESYGRLCENSSWKTIQDESRTSLNWRFSHFFRVRGEFLNARQTKLYNSRTKDYSSSTFVSFTIPGLLLCLL